MTTATRESQSSLRPGTVLVGFAAFGLLWGLYAAALPAIKQNTAASDSDLGTALMFVALAAAPAMFLTGRLLDRAGRPVVIAATVSRPYLSTLPKIPDYHWSVRARQPIDYQVSIVRRLLSPHNSSLARACERTGSPSAPPPTTHLSGRQPLTAPPVTPRTK